jgi:hypothetical protein
MSKQVLYGGREEQVCSIALVNENPEDF